MSGHFLGVRKEPDAADVLGRNIAHTIEKMIDAKIALFSDETTAFHKQALNLEIIQLRLELGGDISVAIREGSKAYENDPRN